MCVEFFNNVALLTRDRDTFDNKVMNDKKKTHVRNINSHYNAYTYSNSRVTANLLPISIHLW